MTATVRRVLRNQRRYPWYRTPLERAAWFARPRYRFSNYAAMMDNLWTAVDRAVSPGLTTVMKRRERRDMVLSHLSNARTYFGMMVGR